MAWDHICGHNEGVAHTYTSHRLSIIYGNVRMQMSLPKLRCWRAHIIPYQFEDMSIFSHTSYATPPPPSNDTNGCTCAVAVFTRVSVIVSIQSPFRRSFHLRKRRWRACVSVSMSMCNSYHFWCIYTYIGKVFIWS